MFAANPRTNARPLSVVMLALGLALIMPAARPSPERAIDPSADWLSAAQREIAHREYRASENEVGLQAPNRAHGLRTYFDPDGIRVHDRTDSGSPELVSLRLAGLGRGDGLVEMAPGAMKSEAERVEIRRPGLVEWFINTEMGLEHGFTIETRPEGNGPLLVDLSVGSARATILGDSVLLKTDAGRTLSYSKLAVVDSKGTPIAARFETPTASRLRMVVEDENAEYPVIIDPLLTGVFDTHLLSDGAGSLFGYGVAGAGDVNGDGYADVIVGAYEYDAGQTKEGAAFIYLGGATGISSVSSSSASAQIESNQEFAYLGISVAGAGDVNGDGFDDVIVGSAFDEGEDAEGAAFIFHGGPDGIADGGPATAQTHLQSNQVEASLGYSVAPAGDVNGDGYGDVVVGAPSFDALLYNDPPPSDDAGEAYVFLGGPAGVADGTPASAATRLQGDHFGALFGATVASAGDVNGDGFSDVIIGARHYSAGQTDESAAFIYHGSATGIPNATAAEAATRIESDYTGNGFIVAAGAGDVNGDGYSDVIIGLPNAGGSTSFGGAAMVFHGSSTGIPNGSPAVGGFASFIYPDQGDASLGASVASAGDVNGDGYSDVVIGAPRYDDPFVDEGVAFVLLGSAAGIPVGTASSIAYKRLGVGNPSALFGSSVAGAGDVNGDGYSDVIAGSTYFGASDEGAAFVFHGGGQGVSNGDPGSAAARFEPELESHGQNLTVSPAGDVNGDGYADLIVGLPHYDGGQPLEGAVFIFLGGARGISEGGLGAAATQIQSDEPYAQFGGPVSSAGDVNGDGYGDVMVLASGIYLGGDGFSPQGAVFIFHGSESGIPSGNLTSASTRLEGPLNPIVGSTFGYSLGTAGDVNGDGYADVIVGDRSYSADIVNAGGAFLFFGSATGVADANPETADARFISDQEGSTFGESVSGAGDVNGDGYADVIVGASVYSAGESLEGAAFLFHGSEGGPADGNPSNSSARLESNQIGARMGGSVAAAGDVNGDGFGDVIVGASSYSSGQLNEGAAFVFAGSASGLVDGNPANAVTQLESDQADARLGWDVSGAGDVDGDGYADVIVVALRLGGSQSNGGAAYVFSGGPSGIADGTPASAATTLESNPVVGRIAGPVAGLGDVNGDGSSDVVVQGLTPGSQPRGTAFVFLGDGDGDGRAVLVRQLRSDASGIPIQPGGWTGDLNTGTFEVRMRATHPMGRGRVKLEVETCAEPVPFGDVACAHQTSEAWTDVTTASGGVEISEAIGDLEADTHYRWRARVLYAPYSVIQVGVVSPPNPAHGPWRRVAGQEAEVNLLPEPDARMPIAVGFVLLVGLGRGRLATVK